MSHKPKLTSEQSKEIRKHFQEANGKSGGHFEEATCSVCGTTYFVQAQINETSPEAYRVVISSVAQALS